MEVFIKKKEDEKMVFSIKGETHTFLQLLKHYLLQNKADYCGYYIDHPASNEALFIVKGKDVEKIIKKAIEQAINELENLRENIPSVE